MSDIVIKIEGLKKRYRLGSIGGGTLSADLQTWWAKVRGKENPNSVLGEDATCCGETFWALNGIDLEIKKGEAIGIIGHNGAGKSTLLKILSRVTAPTEGTIKMNGRISSMLEVGTGFHPELTGRENIYMNGAILGMSRKEVDAKIEEIIDFSECRQFIDTPVKRYSSGMYVKLAFAVAAHLDAEIMIMDEVLAVGDVKFQQKCLNSMLKSSTEDKKTILYVSHNMATVKQLCKRCIVLKQGKIVYDGDTDEAISIYLERNDFEKSSIVNLEDARRLSEHYGKMLHVNRFSFVDVKEAVYEQGEKAKARIDWDVKDDIKNLQLHIVVLDDNYQPVGTMQSKVIDIAQEKSGKGIDITLDLSNLCVGRYSFILNILHVNEYGGVGSYDEPYKYICFEIIEKGSDYSIAWDKKRMGNVHLNGIIIDKM